MTVIAGTFLLFMGIVPPKGFYQLPDAECTRIKLEMGVSAEWPQPICIVRFEGDPR